MFAQISQIIETKWSSIIKKLSKNNEQDANKA